MIKPLLLAASITAAFGAGAALQDDAKSQEAERTAIERAALDYIEAFCEGKPELLERSVHPELAKIGFWQEPDASEPELHAMTREEAIELAGTLKASGHVPEGAEHEVRVLAHDGRIAAVEVNAFWGKDYMHLIRDDDRWRIRHVIWQGPPKSSGGGEH